MTLTDSQWQKISKIENLPASVRSDIELVIFAFVETKRAKSSPPRVPRDAIKKMQAHTKKLQTLIEAFTDENFVMLADCAEEAKDLTDAIVALNKLSDALARTYQQQIDFRLVYTFEFNVKMLLKELLEIRTSALGKPYPTSLQNNTHSGRFRDYLLACLEAAEPGLSKKTFDKVLAKALGLP